MSLDRIAESDQFDFSHVLNNNDDNGPELSLMNTDNCNYYSPDKFKELTQGSDYLSIFGLNCQSINAQWDGLYDLICD